MRKTFSIILLLLCIVATAQIYTPVHWSTAVDSTSEDLVLTHHATIDEGWHMYDINTPGDGPSAIDIAYDNILGLVADGPAQAKGKPITVFDDNFAMDLTYYEKSMDIVQRFKRTEGGIGISGRITYNVCNDGNNCLSNNRYDFSVGQAGGTETENPDGVLQLIDLEIKEDAPGDLWQPAVLPENDISTSRRSLWWILLMGFIGGLVALLTPCVWPVIPMTISFFLHRKDSEHPRRDAMFYGLSIIIIYLAIGLVITAIFGASALNSLATNAVFNLIFFALLVIFALAFFGAFEIMLPSSWANRIDARANNATGFVSILFMAFTLVLVSFSCTGPIIGTLLVEVAVEGGIVAPAIGMFGFALALALPFSLCAMFPDMLKKLPSSGQWMQQVKVCLGFLELAFALKFLSVADMAYGWGLLSRPMFLSLWFAIFLLMGLYLLRILRLKSDGEGGERPGTTGLLLGLCSLAFAAYLLPGLWGAPCNAVSAFAPPMSTQSYVLGDTFVKAHYTDYDLATEAARRERKPIVIDFSGYGCVNCREMESKVWTDPRVRSKLEEDYILVTLMVDDKRQLPQPITVTENGKPLTLTTYGDKWSYLQRNRFGANAQPYYVIQGHDGKVLAAPYGFNTDPAQFLKWLGK